MPKYEKKKTFVYAEQYDGSDESINKIKQLTSTEVQVSEQQVLSIKSIEGHKIAYVGDFVVLDSYQNIFVCNKNVFLGLYALAL